MNVAVYVSFTVVLSIAYVSSPSWLICYWLTTGLSWNPTGTIILWCMYKDIAKFVYCQIHPFFELI